MAFLSRKAICGVCGKEVGLNRYQIKKSDSWCCPDCLKKAGGITAIDVNKITVEDIKDIINQKNQKQSASPLHSGEGMYEYCKQNGFGDGTSSKWAIAHFSVIADNLDADESVKIAFMGLHDYKSMTKHENNYGYAITNKRLIYAQKKAIGANCKSVSLKNINDIGLETGMALGILTVDARGEKFKVGVDKVSAKNIFSEIQNILKENSAFSPSTTANAPAFSAADELKKFKELLDAEIITQEEFEAKKKQLLGL